MAKRKGSFANYDGPPGTPGFPAIEQSKDFKKVGSAGISGSKGKARRRDPRPGAGNVPKLGGPERDRKLARWTDTSRGG